MEIGCLHFQVGKLSLQSTPWIKQRQEKENLFLFFCLWCAQGRSLEMNHPGAGKIIIAIITTVHQWFTNASVGLSMLFKEHSFLLHLIWSLWQPQEVHKVDITITVLHLSILSCRGCRGIYPESQGWVVAALEAEPRFSATYCLINGLYVMPTHRNSQDTKKFQTSLSFRSPNQWFWRFSDLLGSSQTRTGMQTG